jgi:Ser/Thr protein kinase RdoA (MazF antagonist)
MSEDGLCEWIGREYALGRPVACELLRSYTNDVHAVQSPLGRFVLKLYGRGWRTEPEIRYEVALIQHLSAGGLPTPASVAATDGDFLTQMDTPDGSRQAVLYTYAPGAKPRSPFNPQLYQAFGEAVGRMHALSDDFVTKHRRRPLDLNLLIDEPLRLALPLVEAPEDRAFLADTAGRVRDRIEELAAEGLDWGPIHGDATLDNLHVTADGAVVLYDFDSGGPGWRAADLQGWAAQSHEHQEKWDAFKRGYSKVRPLRPAELLAAPVLTVVWDIWGLQIDLDHRVLKQGREQAGAYLREQVALIRARAAALLPR